MAISAADCGTDRITAGCSTCFYCNMPLPKRHEHDHFPIPKSASGTALVAACMNCHELKDRTPIDRWPMDHSVAAVTGLCRVIGENRAGAFLEVLAGTTARSPLIDMTHRELIHRDRWWGSASPTTRILYAKVVSCAHQPKVAT